MRPRFQTKDEASIPAHHRDVTAVILVFVLLGGQDRVDRRHPERGGHVMEEMIGRWVLRVEPFLTLPLDGDEGIQIRPSATTRRGLCEHVHDPLEFGHRERS